MDVHTYDTIREALHFIPAHDRELWLRIGMAIKSELSDGGFELWDEWSRTADNYNAKNARTVWKSIKANGKVTAGTLFHEAKAHGWRDDGTYRKPTPEELEAQRRIAAERAAKEEAEIASECAEAAKKAAAIWKSSQCVGLHHYLTRKRVEAFGIRQSRGALVIPLRDTAGEIHGLQFIDAEGNKRFLTGGAITGHYFAIGRYQGTLCIAEGYATAATVHQATGHAVAVAFNAGNLKPVALALRSKFPDAKLILCADNDRFTPGNPGVTKAREAALAVGGLLSVPRFSDVGPFDYYMEGERHG